ncbi:MAG: GvpL/GvpF family gas vesicle protein [Candidatus Bipolaricaulia bacterium]
MSTDRKFIYGVINTEREKRFDFTGIGGGEVYNICHRDISALVSDAPGLAFDSIPKEEILRHLVIYQYVAEQVMRDGDCTVIPVKFGTMAEGQAEVKKILSKGYPRFKHSLDELDGKIEFDIVALWNDMDSVFQEIREEQEIQEVIAGITGKPPREAHQDKVKVGELVQEKLVQKRKKLSDEITGSLKQAACDLREHELLEGEAMIMNVSFLVDKKDVEGFNRKLYELDERYEGQLTFRQVGPLPPYSFNMMEVQEIGFEQFNHACRRLELRGDQVTALEIEQAYQRLSRKYHPDQRGGDPERFEQITEAYQLLIDYCENTPKEDGRYPFIEENRKDFIIKVVAPQPLKSVVAA